MLFAIETEARGVYVLRKVNLRSLIQSVTIEKRKNRCPPLFCLGIEMLDFTHSAAC